MFSLGDHGRDHGPAGADRHLLRCGCGSELGAVEHCRFSSWLSHKGMLSGGFKTMQG
jgi:hypothetical protein